MSTGSDSSEKPQYDWRGSVEEWIGSLRKNGKLNQACSEDYLSMITRGLEMLDAEGRPTDPSDITNEDLDYLMNQTQVRSTAIRMSNLVYRWVLWAVGNKNNLKNTRERRFQERISKQDACDDLMKFEALIPEWECYLADRGYSDRTINQYKYSMRHLIRVMHENGLQSDPDMMDEPEFDFIANSDLSTNTIHLYLFAIMLWLEWRSRNLCDQAYICGPNPVMHCDCPEHPRSSTGRLILHETPDMKVP